MKRETREAWVKDLRSGKYNQCRNKMRDGHGGFCCLGVLAHKTLKLLDEETTGGHNNEYTDFCNIKCEYNPNYDYFYDSDKLWGCLADANDGRGKYSGNPQSFEQIADLIEKIVPVE